jgi:hypothetical protein
MLTLNTASASPPDPSGHRVEIITTLADVERHRDTWLALQWHPNADIDFFSLIVRSRPEVVSPYVLVILKDNKPVALLAGRLEEGHFEIKVGYQVLWRPKVRKLTIIHGGFMGQANASVSEIMVRQLLKALREQQADMISWGGLVWKSPLHHLVQRAPGWLCRDYLARANGHWTMNLPESLEVLLDRKMNKKHRYWAKRAMRVLEKDFPGSVRYVCYAKPDEVEKLYADAVGIARKTYQWGLGAGLQENPENCQRLRLAADSGWLRGYVLYLNEEPAAFWICTVYRGTIHLNFTGYDPNLRKYEVGTALFLRIIGELHQQGVKHLDFGMGSAFYKERFGDARFDETTLCIFRLSLRGVILNALRLLTEGPAGLSRKLLVRLRLEQRVKRLWRSRVTPVQSGKESFNART